jgi:ABC-type Mn2+/Zn2+ transport system ATPase subunit
MPITRPTIDSGEDSAMATTLDLRPARAADALRRASRWINWPMVAGWGMNPVPGSPSGPPATGDGVLSGPPATGDGVLSGPPATGDGVLSGPPATGDAVVAQDLGVDRGPNRVLDGIDLAIPQASSAAVIGPNGSGKTTLLLVVTGLIKPSRGSMSLAPGAKVAYVQQRHDARVWLPLTVGEVITMGRYGKRGYLGRLQRSDRQLIAAAADRLEVTDLLGRQFGELSGGQRQRVLLAQALAQDPTVLLLDEPITGLDLASQQRILDLIDEETGRGTTVVITTHNLDEARHCDRVLLLAGHRVAWGPPDEVLQPTHLREAFGDRLLGDHRHHNHSRALLIVDDHGH